MSILTTRTFVLLHGSVKSNYYFQYIDVGCFGHGGDSSIMKTNKLFNLLCTYHNLYLPNSLWEQPMPYVFVADEAFGLCTNVMRPYPVRKLTWNQTLVNCTVQSTAFNVDFAY